ncbi:hypothetical protein KHA90_21660 [Flavobacterium psychroterrae]|uniref:Tox-MPTase2 domain-containing protein n=1 Tax=Flavobacterium psychroterrae TaxID=2133767 RepID=A0ABS5PHA6_9FLAO|nr:hypothetical protein [Flavobacterium psychroterrae]MBS7233625.1 hypothetical protein [Flavobacterium psychroterrae]
MIIRKHNIQLKDTSESEMARFRQIMLSIWRQQIEDDKNAEEMESFIKKNSITNKKSDQNKPKKHYNNDIFYVNSDGNIIKVEVDNSRYINVVLSNGKKVLFSDLDISGSTFSWNNTNRQIVANIARYYGKQINVTRIGANYDMNDKSLAYTDSQSKVWLHPSSKGGVDPTFNHKYNLKSTLIHEYNHQQELKTKKKLKKKKEYTYSEHAKVYLKQFKHNTFEKTSIKYSEGQIANFIKYLDYASGQKETGWENILKEFNESKILGGYFIKYRESGGTQLFDNKGVERIIEISEPLDGPH